MVTGNSDESLPNAKAVATDQSRGGSASTTMTTDQDSTSIKPTKNNAGYAEIGEEYANHGYQYRDVDIDDEQDDIVADQVMLFFAAASFMAVGVMNFFRERQVFHIWMVQGGVFGILAALCMQASSFATLMLQTVSVHCFLIEAIFMLRARRTKDANNGMQFAGWTADILFAMGAVMHVIMVYWQHGDDKAYASVRLAKTGVVSAWLWLICAGIQSYCTIVALAQRMEEQTIINQHHHSESLHPNGERYTIKPAAIQRRRMQQQNKNSDHDDEESIYPSQEDFVIS